MDTDWMDYREQQAMFGFCLLVWTDGEKLISERVWMVEAG